MFIRRTCLILGTALLFIGSALRADTIQLVNGDRLKGKVASLNDKELVLKSESFGELKIPRDKIDLISLGDKGLPDFTKPATVKPQVVPQSSAQTDETLGDPNNLGQYLQDPSVQSQLGPMVEQLLGPKADRNTQQRIDEARRGMKELRKDLGKSPEGDALDSYIRFFEQIAPLARGLQDAQPRPSVKGRRAPHDGKDAPKDASPKPADKGSAVPDKTNEGVNPTDQQNAEQPAAPK
jgi:hypothetical protein